MKRIITILTIGLIVLAFGLSRNEPAKAQDKSLLEEYLPNLNPSAGIKKVPQMIENYRNAGAIFERRELFEPNARPISGDDDLGDALSEGVVFNLDKAAVKKILKENLQFLTLPIADGKGGVIELELAKVNILAPGFKVQTSEKTTESLEESYGIHYRGIIKGDLKSLASISIFKNEVMGIFSTDKTGSIVLGRLGGNNPNDRHVLYDDRNLKFRPNKFCDVETSDSITLPEPKPESQEEAVARCARIYVEANYNVFQNKGSVANTVSYVTGFFNQSATLIANTGASVSLSEVFVWTSPSPYTATDTSTQLQLFRNNRQTFNGNMAHLVDLQNIGGRAYLNAYCHPTDRHAYSGIFSTFSNVPTYSFTVQIFSHETGHNLGSPHTHACAWNGNNTAIDGCSTVEGACANPGLPIGGGTIMSYCYNTSAGVNFNLGYGPQPSSLILNRFNAATCLTDCAVSCSSSPITVGQTVNGNLQSGDCLLSDNSYYDAYTFSGTAGQQIAISMNSTQLNAYLFLIQGNYPGGTTLVTDDNGGGGTNARIPATSGYFTLPATGTYTILANSLSAGEIGAYSLTLSTAGCATTPIASGQTLNGTLSTTDCIVSGSTRYVDTFTFSGTAGQQIAVSMNSTAFDTYLYLVNSSNLILAENDDGGGGTNSRIPATSGFFTLPATGTYQIWASSFLNSSTGAYSVSLTTGTTSTNRKSFDFDGDNKTDIGIFRPSNGQWWINRSSNGSTFATTFGNSADRIAPADYTGDGKTDIAFFRPSNGTWYVLRSEDSSFYAFAFGTNGDIPAPGYFDNDNKADATVFRPSTATWYTFRSSDNGTTITQFGANGDIPVIGNYDGDNRDDIAIFRPSTGVWWISRSSSSVIAYQFGASTDKPVGGDFTGDGKADAAIWRPSNGFWYVLRSEDLSFYAAPFGANGDIPLTGDYDGDGRSDFAVFRPSNSVWYVNRSTAGNLTQGFGIAGDKPVPSAFVP